MNARVVRLSFIWWLFVFLALFTGTASMQGASFQGLGDLSGGAPESTACDVSADGSVVVGSSSSSSGTQAFRWSSEFGMVGLGHVSPGEHESSVARGVSADGSIIVGYSGSGWENFFEGDAFRCLWLPIGIGIMEGLGQTGYNTRAYDVSDDGSVIVGWREPGTVGWMSEAYRWTPTGDGPIVPADDVYTRATAVSADGLVVAGHMRTLGDYYAFRWSEKDRLQWLGTVSEYDEQVPHAISADGSVIVGEVAYRGFMMPTEAFRWTEKEGIVLLGALPTPDDSTWSAAYDVAADGSVIVGSSTGGLQGPAQQKAVIWDGGGTEVLQEILEEECDLDLAGWTLTEATGISADGRVIVGTGVNPFGECEAWRAVIPEPPACLLLLTGLLAPAAYTLRRRKREERVKSSAVRNVPR